MTTEELEERLAAHAVKMQELVSSLAGPLVEANKIQAASEELHVKRAAEHDAQARAQQERATSALDFQRRNVEAWERIAGALEAKTMAGTSPRQPPPVCTGSNQLVFGYGSYAPRPCPICAREVEVVLHTLGQSLALHAYQPL